MPKKYIPIICSASTAPLARLGSKQYEITNHSSRILTASLGNVDNKLANFEKSCLLIVMPNNKKDVFFHNQLCFGMLATINDSWLPDNTTYPSKKVKAPVVLTWQDYYPFGMLMPNRNYSLNTNVYRYGFNGKESDDEVKGEGNSYDFGARIYDSRLGRFLCIDPDGFKFPFKSTYASFNNNPNYFVDPTGRTGEASLYKVKTRAEAKSLGVKRGETIVLVTANIIFYGTEANNVHIHKVATNVETKLNAAKGTEQIENSKGKTITYNVRFKITADDHALNCSDDEIKDEVEANFSFKNNYIRVESNNKSSGIGIGGNAGIFDTNDELEISITATHEILHGLGLGHIFRLIGGKLDIMTPRNGMDGMNPDARQVLPQTINRIGLSDSFKGKQLNQKVNVGSIAWHGYHDKNYKYHASKDEKKNTPITPIGKL